MSFLQLARKRFLIFGVANKKSIAWHIARMLREEQAEVVFVVRDLPTAEQVRKLLAGSEQKRPVTRESQHKRPVTRGSEHKRPVTWESQQERPVTRESQQERQDCAEAGVFVCDVEQDEQIARLRDEVGTKYDRFDGLVHSIAFADFSGGIPAKTPGNAKTPGYTAGLQPFHLTDKKAFLQAVDISCFSLVSVCRAFADCLDTNASVVTISISTTRMASENYGYMAPIKAALDSTIVFLAKSFSRFSNVRFNAVAPGLLKTSASAGIPGYLDSYLFAEQVIPRKSALTTEEAAAAAVFLLSPRSSGINAQKIIVDAGMSINYFDKDIIGKAVH